MKSLRALLSPREESALRKVGLSCDDVLDPGHVQRLLQLELIQQRDGRWSLTALGRQRFDALERQAPVAKASMVEQP